MFGSRFRSWHYFFLNFFYLANSLPEEYTARWPMNFHVSRTIVAVTSYKSFSRLYLFIFSEYITVTVSREEFTIQHNDVQMLVIHSGDISRASCVFKAMGSQFVIFAFNIGEVTPIDVEDDMQVSRAKVLNKSILTIGGRRFKFAEKNWLMQCFCTKLS